jgi:hypothetical protein
MNQDTARAKTEMKAAVHGLLESLPRIEPQLPQGLQLKIAALGEFAVRGRTQVPRDGKSKTMLCVPEAESATRLPQQLGQLAKGSALIGGREVADEEDYATAKRVALDCIPALRRAVLDSLIAGNGTSAAGLPTSTLHYVVEDLTVLELVTNDSISPLADGLLAKAGIKCASRDVTTPRERFRDPPEWS